MLHVVVICVAFRDCLVRLCLFALHLELKLLQLFLLCLVSELKALKVALKLVLRGLSLLQVTRQLNKLLVLFVLQRVSVPAQIVSVRSKLGAPALVLIEVAA